jgi:hypothetical protein
VNRFRGFRQTEAHALEIELVVVNARAGPPLASTRELELVGAPPRGGGDRAARDGDEQQPSADAAREM